MMTMKNEEDDEQEEEGKEEEDDDEDKHEDEGNVEQKRKNGPNPDRERKKAQRGGIKYRTERPIWVFIITGVVLCAPFPIGRLREELKGAKDL